ncbi:hypothetical protein GCM10027454_42390 [Algoriphagus aestuariicola]
MIQLTLIDVGDRGAMDDGIWRFLGDELLDLPLIGDIHALIEKSSSAQSTWSFTSSHYLKLASLDELLD